MILQNSRTIPGQKALSQIPGPNQFMDFSRSVLTLCNQAFHIKYQALYFFQEIKKISLIVLYVAVMINSFWVKCVSIQGSLQDLIAF